MRSRSLRCFAGALALVVSTVVSAGAQPARRVKDIGQTLRTTSHSLFVGISDHRAVGNTYYFSADDGSSGVELWKSDGTPEGTDIVADIAPGPLSSYAAGFVELNGLVYFSAWEPLTGTGIWVTDGTAVGTHLVRSIQPGPFTGQVGLLAFEGSLYFVAFDSVHGWELWVSDGTSEGTQVIDLWPGETSSYPSSLTTFAGALYFFASQPDGTYGFFRLNAGSLTPTLVRSFPPILVGDRFTYAVGPGDLTVVGDTAYFEGTDKVSGIELWKTDGTTAGTVLVKDINPGPSNSFPYSLVAAGGKVFFQADDGSGFWLWTSDGTAAGTARVPPPSPGSKVLTQTTALGVLSGSLIVSGVDPAVNNIFTLVRTDGTLSGTVSLHEFSQFGVAGTAVVGRDLYFSAGDSETGVELWRTDGTPIGTVLVKDIRPGGAGSFPGGMAEYSGKLLFFASDGRANSSLWSSDGTSQGTQIVRDINLPGSDPSFLVPSGSRVFFTALDPADQTRRLWISDGSKAGTQRLSQAVIQTQADFPSPNIVLWRNNLYFSAIDEVGAEPWVSDGTPSGTKRLIDIFTGPDGSYPAAFTPFQDSLFFFARDPVAGLQLWKTDGSEFGTIRVTAVPTLFGFSVGLFALVPSGQFLFFSNDDGVHGLELWRSDGTPLGTQLVKDIYPGAEGSSPANLTAFNGLVCFEASDDTHGAELWRSDGTQAGTTLVKDIVPGPDSSAPFQLTVVGQSLFFTVGIGFHDLWKTDGTESGTVFVKSFAGSISQLTSSGGQLFFVADDGEHGSELWRSDGTTEGTRMVLDILPGPASSSPDALFDAGGILVFSATDREHGNELWRSDGTEAGTFLVHDINPGIRSSNPSAFALAGDSIFFAADDGSSGKELRVMPVSALFPQPQERVRSTRGIPFRP